MVDSAVLERVERAPTPEKELQGILGAIEKHFAAKEASAWRPDSPEDLVKRLTGAEVLQRMSRLIVENYSDRTRPELLDKRIKMEGVMARLAIEYLTKKAAIKRVAISSREAMRAAQDVVVTPFRKGLFGHVAPARMAQEAGFSLEWPTLDQDVREGIDLIIEKKDSGKIPLQVKCHEGCKFAVFKDKRNGLLIHVDIPAPPDSSFYEDPELGIPRHLISYRFVDYINQQRGAR